MSELYSIQDTTLTALGDAVRNKASKYISVEEKGEPFFTATIDTTLVEPNYTYSGIYYYEVPIDFPTLLGDMYDYTKRLYVEYEYEVSLNQFWCNITFRSDEQYKGTQGTIVNIFNQSSPLSGTGSKYGFISTLPYNQLQLNVYPSQIESGKTAKVSVKIWACDASDKFLVLNKYTPLEMVDEINGLMTIPDEALNLTGECQYRFAYGSNDWLINTAGDKITTKDIRNANYMFQNSKVKSIPFEINLKDNTLIGSSMFEDCVNLKEMPQVNVVITDSKEVNYTFRGCYRMREIPEWFIDYLEQSYNYGNNNSFFGGPAENVFQRCYSLRKIPDRAMKALGVNGTPSSNYYTFAYSKPFSYCYCLDEILNMPCDNITFTSNQFSSFFTGIYRAKNITFQTNEDGTPMIRNWKSQTIDLSSYIGYGSALGDYINYNSGITADKQVKDDATYQALKNDPDWFSLDINYSRYNHDSAVNTINSLPDCSASGGTNTIKFKGAAGALTDGGAINTLTEEEIAVATAKGWVVSFV